MLELIVRPQGAADESDPRPATAKQKTAGLNQCLEVAVSGPEIETVGAWL